MLGPPTGVDTYLSYPPECDIMAVVSKSSMDAMNMEDTKSPSTQERAGIRAVVCSKADDECPVLPVTDLADNIGVSLGITAGSNTGIEVFP